MDNNNPNKKIDIEIKPEVAQGRYANLVIITHSSSEFILDFVQTILHPEEGVYDCVGGIDLGTVTSVLAADVIDSRVY